MRGAAGLWERASSSSLVEASFEASLGDAGVGGRVACVTFALCFRPSLEGVGSSMIGAVLLFSGATVSSSCSSMAGLTDVDVAAAGCPKNSTVFFLIGLFGQLILSWLQPFTHPPQRRAGMVGEPAREDCDCGLLGVIDGGLVPPAAAALRFSSDHVRSSFCRMYFLFCSLCFMIMNSQWLTLRRSSKYSTDQWYLQRVSWCHACPA